MGPRNHVLDGGKGQPVVKFRETLQSSVQKQLNQLRCRLGFGLVWAQGIMWNHGSRSIFMGMTNFNGEMGTHCKV